MDKFKKDLVTYNDVKNSFNFETPQMVYNDKYFELSNSMVKLEDELTKLNIKHDCSMLKLMGEQDKALFDFDEDFIKWVEKEFKGCLVEVNATLSILQVFVNDRKVLETQYTLDGSTFSKWVCRNYYSRLPLIHKIIVEYKKRYWGN